MVTDNGDTATQVNEQELAEDSWQDLFNITADPPERREKCDKCK